MLVYFFLVKKLQSPAHKWPCAARGLFHVHHVITTSWTSALHLLCICIALHQKKNTEKLRTFFFQNCTDRTSAPCGAGRWAVPSCLACFKSNSRTLTFGILIAPIRFSEVKMVPELSVRLLKGVMSGTCGGIKVSNSLTAQLRWTSRSFNQNSRSAVFLLDAFHRLEFRLRGLPKIWEQRTAARRPRSTPTMFSAHHAHGFSKQTQRIKIPSQLSKTTKVKCYKLWIEACFSTDVTALAQRELDSTLQSLELYKKDSCDKVRGQNRENVDRKHFIQASIDKAWFELATFDSFPCGLLGGLALQMA